jgi:hypothetical protein
MAVYFALGFGRKPLYFRPFGPLTVTGTGVGMIVLITFTTLASLIPLAAGTAPVTLFGGIALASAGGTVAATLAALFLMPLLLVSRRTTRLARR